MNFFLFLGGYCVAKFYGISKEELAYIIEKFLLVDAKQKELVLREY